MTNDFLLWLADCADRAPAAERTLLIRSALASSQVSHPCDEVRTLCGEMLADMRAARLAAR